jgi:hypothetical protein
MRARYQASTIPRWMKIFLRDKRTLETAEWQAKISLAAPDAQR